jgi:hypothetical protein
MDWPGRMSSRSGYSGAAGSVIGVAGQIASSGATDFAPVYAPLCFVVLGMAAMGTAELGVAGVGVAGQRAACTFDGLGRPLAALPRDCGRPPVCRPSRSATRPYPVPAWQWASLGSSGYMSWHCGCCQPKSGPRGETRLLYQSANARFGNAGVLTSSRRGWLLLGWVELGVELGVHLGAVLLVWRLALRLPPGWAVLGARLGGVVLVVALPPGWVVVLVLRPHRALLGGMLAVIARGARIVRHLSSQSASTSILEGLTM